MANNTLLLCTDLDRTLLPNGTQPEFPQARQHFYRFVAHSNIILAYVTGRDKNLVQQAISNFQLPNADFIISDVGSNIYDLRGGGWQAWLEWQKMIAQDWRGRTHQQLRTLFQDIDALRLQEHTKQNTFKLSFYVPLNANHAALHKVIQSRLLDADVQACLVWSVDEPAGVGLLDILPRQASKLHAIEALQNYLSIPPEWTLFAGDSGNDLPVLASHIPSILVANATKSVKEHAKTEAEKQGNSLQLYLAQGGFLGMNGNYSAGILEGIVHYHPRLKERIATMVLGQ